MNTNNQFDVVILGGGPAGYSAALKAGRANLKTALIEQERLGGICLNWGCIPSKTLMSCAQLYGKLRQAESYGISGIDPSKIKPQWNKMLEKAHKNSNKAVNDIKILLEKAPVDIINETGTISGKNTISVKGEKIQFEHLVIATGSKYTTSDLTKENYPYLYTPKTIYELPKLPTSMTILGAGVIGIEFAFLFAELGVKVILIEKSHALMPYMDNDLVHYLEKLFRDKKIDLRLGWEAINIDNEGLHVDHSDKEELIETDIYLSALDRKANLAAVQPLIQLGMELKRGFIKTDLKTRTSLPNIYAVGDVNGRFMTSHVAAREGETAIATILGKSDEIIYDLMPYNMYCNPEFASIGLTERSANNQGFLVGTGTFPFSANAKALTEGDPEGFVKVIVDKQSGEILGVHIVGRNATDQIGEAASLMTLGASIKDFAHIVHAHPTMSEAFVEAILRGIN